MKRHMFVFVEDNNALRALILSHIGESGLVQKEVGDVVSRDQSWVSKSLVAEPAKTIRRLFIKHPEKFEALIKKLSLPEQRVLMLAGVLKPEVANAAEPISIGRFVPIFHAGAGPALDDADAVDGMAIPIQRRGSYDLIGLKITGNSMNPYLRDGDIAIVACEPSLIKAGKPIGLYIPDVGSVVKVFVRALEDGSLLLQSLNAAKGEEEFFVAPPESRIYGPVVNRYLQD